MALGKILDKVQSSCEIKHDLNPLKALQISEIVKKKKIAQIFYIKILRL